MNQGGTAVIVFPSLTDFYKFVRDFFIANIHFK